jgi:hypothetical protein
MTGTQFWSAEPADTMTKDRNGKVVRLGDKVMVPCVITWIDDRGNIGVTVTEKRTEERPCGNTVMILSSRQVEKVDA